MSWSSGNLYGLLFFLLGIVEFTANVISTSSFGRVSEKILYRVRVSSLKCLFAEDINWHESEGRTPGTLISYISSNANSLSGVTGTVLGVMLSIIVSLFAGVILAHIVAWKIAVVLLATVPVLLAAGFLRVRVLAEFHERHQKAFAHSVSLANEAAESIKTVAAFSLEQEVLEVFNRSLVAPYVETLKTIAYGNFWLAMAYSIGNFIYALPIGGALDKLWKATILSFNSLRSSQLCFSVLSYVAKYFRSHRKFRRLAYPLQEC
jgi:ATP-binding cassette subfamily B (MDR/TAP) protein 1